MKKKMKICVCVIIIVMVSYLYAHIDKNNMIYDKNIADNEYQTTGNIIEGSLVQTFVCQEDKLDGIRIKTIKNGDLSNVTINYIITDLETKKEYSGSVVGNDIKNNKYYKFEIGQQLVGCKGKSFQIEISEEGSSDYNGVSFYMTPTQAEQTTLSLNNYDQDKTVIMKTVTHRFDMETFVMMIVSICFVCGFMKILYYLFNK
ncbi:MAG: hypothetical protein PHW34_14490 [Hespellia sp.]|nr:hypothetical protein [Hespellia sp.]